MELSIGQRVAYPGQGVCEVEKIEVRRVGESNIECCLLRVVGDDSHILVPVANAEAVGIRSVISLSQCRRLINRLAGISKTFPLTGKRAPSNLLKSCNQEMFLRPLTFSRSLLFLATARSFPFANKPFSKRPSTY